MRWRGLIAATLCMIVATVFLTVYENSLAPPVGRQDEQGKKNFRLCETEPCESYLELLDPLDDWTAQAIQNLTESVNVDEQNWNQCQITKFNATVFKYGEEFYTFTYGMHTSRTVRIHLDPLNELGSGKYISLCKTTYSPNEPCYELHDPLDSWTEAAIEDPINLVEVNGIYIYRNQCALLKVSWQSIFKYQGEYYALDRFLLYDGGFRPTFRVPILIGWIVIGLSWLGSGLYELMRTRFFKGGWVGGGSKADSLAT